MARTAAILGLGLAFAPATAFAGGMPQLDFANPLLTSQVVWGALIFTVLYLALSWYALPKVGQVLAARADSIAVDLNTAQSAKQAADAALAQAAVSRHAAMVQSQAALNAATDQAKQQAAAQAAKLNAALDAQLKTAEAQIVSARQAAMGALGEVAAETASVLITKLTGKRASEQHLANVVASVMAQQGIGAA